MKVRLLGFKWAMPGLLSPRQFADRVIAKSGTVFQFAGHDRFLHADLHEDRLVGVLLTLKQQKRYTAINDATFRVSVEKLKKGTSLVDFNFFAVSRHVTNNTHHGLYSHHHNSTGLNMFNQLVVEESQSLLTELAAEAATSGAEGRSEAEQQRHAKLVRKRYDTAIAPDWLLRDEDWPLLLDELARIREVSFRVTSLKSGDSLFFANATAVKSQTYKITFSAKADQPSLRRQVTAYLQSLGLKRGTIKGKTPAGGDTTINLENTPIGFSAYEYDEVIGSTPFIDYEHIGGSEFVRIMCEEMDKQPHFGDLT